MESLNTLCHYLSVLFIHVIFLSDELCSQTYVVMNNLEMYLEYV